jgi:hypothetical protein
MKSVSIIVTREELKESQELIKFWVALFVVSIMLSLVIRFFDTILLSVSGLFFSLLSWLSNTKYLATRGKVVSKNVVDINSAKNSLMVLNIMNAFWIVFFGVLSLLFIIVDYRNALGFLPIFAFMAYITIRRKNLIARSLKK